MGCGGERRQGGIPVAGSAPAPAMGDLTRNVEQTTYASSLASAGHAQLPLEAPLHIEVNGRHLATLMRLPGNDRELALGFWLTEGLIESRDEVASLAHCPDDPNLLRMTLTRELPERAPMAIGTACGGLLGGELPEAMRVNGALVAAKVLMEMPAVLEEHQPVRKQVGGVHGAAVCAAGGELLIAAEDIGRHNAMDKVLGHCLLTGQPLTDKVVVITGRASAEMVIKAVRARVPVLGTSAGLTSLGAQLAGDLGLTLVARLRESSMQVMAHAQRIT